MEKSAVLLRSSFVRRLGSAVLSAALAAVAGCAAGSPVSDIQAGSITFTDVNGTPLKTKPQSFTAGQGSYVDVTVLNDPQLLGADWTVYCGSALPPGTPPPPGQTVDESCGTFTPAHTMSGPIPSYLTSATGYVAFYTAPAITPKDGVVTLYASSTSNPTKFSSVTLTIGGLPISVQLAPTPSNSLHVSASTLIRAVLNNDTAGAGVKWTVLCGSSDCGSFTPTQTISGEATTYTAPAAVPTGGTVQVTATSISDPTKAVSATISIQ